VSFKVAEIFGLLKHLTMLHVTAWHLGLKHPCWPDLRRRWEEFLLFSTLFPRAELYGGAMG